MQTLPRRLVPVNGPARRTTPLTSRTWPAVLASVLLVASVMTMLFVRNHRYFFIDDRQADGVGKLVELGRILLSGEWPWLSTNGVSSGGYAVEYQNGVFNPANLALGVVMVKLDDAALASFVQILVHTLLLAGAAAWLGRLLGLPLRWIIAFAVSIGLQPYTIYWVAGWYQVVTAFSWFVLAVTAAYALHLRPRKRYGWTLLFATYCCYTSGWPLAIPVLGLVVLTLLLARLATRQPARATWWLGAWYAGGALTSLIALYPLMLSLQVATRTSAVGNSSNFLVVPLEGLLHFPDPTYWPWFNNFGGYALQRYPHLYVAWFVLPVLVLWRPSPMRQAARALWITSLVLLALTVFGALGPERLLLFRFPLRFAQYSGFFLLVVTAMLVANGRAVFSRRRLWVLMSICGVLLLTSIQSDPSSVLRILLLGLVMVALCAATWWAGARGGTLSPGVQSVEGSADVRRSTRSGSRIGGFLAVDSVVSAGTVLVLAWLGYVNPVGRGLDWGFPSDLSTVPRLSQQDYTLFYGSYPPLKAPDQLPSPSEQADVQQYYREYHASSMGLLVGDREVNGYSPLGYRSFQDRFPMDDQGNFGPEGADRFTAQDPETGVSWLEMLRVDQVITQLGPRDKQLTQLLGAPWTRYSEGRMMATYRHPAYSLPGLVSYAAPGTQVAQVAGCPLRHSTECTQVTSPALGPGRVVFARLWFPGYSASLDGVPLPVDRHADMLVSVDVPAGRSGKLVLTYTSPGLVPFGSLAVGVLIAAGVTSVLVPMTGPRRARRKGAGNGDGDARQAGEGRKGDDEEGGTGVKDDRVDGRPAPSPLAAVSSSRGSSGSDSDGAGGSGAVYRP